MRGGMKLFFIRAFRAAKLDAGVFDEVMENPKLMTQAIIVVFIYGAAVAYGSFGRAGVAGIKWVHINGMCELLS